MFLQISQLKDKFFFIESFLNHTDMKRSKSYMSASKLSKETEDTPATIPPNPQADGGSDILVQIKI